MAIVIWAEFGWLTSVAYQFKYNVILTVTTTTTPDDESPHKDC